MEFFQRLHFLIINRALIKQELIGISMEQPNLVTIRWQNRPNALKCLLRKNKMATSQDEKSIW